MLLPERWNHLDEYDSIRDDYEARKQEIEAAKAAIDATTPAGEEKPSLSPAEAEEAGSLTPRQRASYDYLREAGLSHGLALSQASGSYLRSQNK